MQDLEYTIMYQVEDTHFWFRGMRNIVGTLVTQLSLPPRAKILDAGCGTGANLIFLRRFGHVDGVDASPLARRFSARRGIKIKQGNINLLPYSANSFDLVTCFDVFDVEGVNEKKAMNEFRRVLKPSGYLMIHVPAYQWLHCSHDQIFQTARRYTCSSLASIMQKSKLKVIRQTYANTLLFPPQALKRLMRKYLPFLFTNVHGDTEPIPKVINALFYLPFLVESILLRSFNLPFGLSVFVIAQKSK